MIVLMMAVLALPILNLTVLPIKQSKLAGVESSGSQALSLAGFFSGQLQAWVENRFQRASGILGYLVKTDNQLDYFLFKQISSNRRAKVILGNDDQLIERAYLPSANKSRPVKHQAIGEATAALAELQARLKTRNIELLVIVSPSKPNYYPQALPSWYRVAGAETRQGGGDYFLEELSRAGVNFIDAQRVLKAAEGSEFPYPMFSNTGTHWSQLGGCLAAAEITKRIGELLKRTVPKIECQVDGMRDLPVAQDADLLRLANLWFPHLLKRPAPRVSSKRVEAEGAFFPRITMIGSSFCWELLRHIDRNHVFRSRDFLYYFRRRFDGNKQDRRGVSIDQEKFDFEKELADQDLVLIEINFSAPQHVGFGFVQAANQKLQMLGK